ncbi:MAG: ribonuclease J [Alphaproteobacteria bacterium]
MARNDKKSAKDPTSELVFLPLGGAGEIGMNVYLYGLGPEDARQWLMVDCGVTFPDDREPGVDVVFPDLRFIEDERANLAAIVLTHAHEDHFGAVAEVWPRLRVPVYGTRFSVAMLREKLEEYPWREEVPIHEVAPGDRLDIGPFDIEIISMAHSIPDATALAIRTPLGTVLHSGDWKLDPKPGAGAPTDETALRRLGDEGVDVLVCDSTTIFSEGTTTSEADVAATLGRVIRQARGRIAITSFASSVSRLLGVARAASSASRELVLVGRSMHRIVEIARDTGLWPEKLKTHTEEEFSRIPAHKVVALLTGSQGESRAALARIADKQHPLVSLSHGDTVVFSARAIPGNEQAINRILNNLADMHVETITEWPDGPIHTSGHPRRGDVAQLYEWVRPKALIPMHGEPRHLEAHATFAREHDIAALSDVRNGHMVRLLPGEAAIIDEAPVGKIYRDGALLVSGDEDMIRQRRKLSFVGAVTVSVVMKKGGDFACDPQIVTTGLPMTDARGEQFSAIAETAIFGAIESIPRPRRKDADMLAEAVRRSVRSAVRNAWGKKPICTVMVSVV